MSDAQLLQGLRDGRREALARFLDRFGPRVQSLARRYARSQADAEDLTQEIFLDLFQSLGGFRGEAKLETWVYRVALNHCLRWKQKHERELSRLGAQPSNELELPSRDASGDPQKQMARGELGEKVRCAVGDLGDLHREIIILHEMHGLTYAQCAEVLQIPVGTVKSRLSNAFSQLRRALEPYILGDQP